MEFFLLFIYSMTWDKSLHLLKWGFPSFPSFLLYEGDTRELYEERWPKLVLLKLLNRGLGGFAMVCGVKKLFSCHRYKEQLWGTCSEEVRSAVSAELVFGDKTFLTLLSGENSRLKTQNSTKVLKRNMGPLPIFHPWVLVLALCREKINHLDKR